MQQIWTAIEHDGPNHLIRCCAQESMTNAPEFKRPGHDELLSTMVAERPFSDLSLSLNSQRHCLFCDLSLSLSAERRQLCEGRGEGRTWERREEMRGERGKLGQRRCLSATLHGL